MDSIRGWIYTVCTGAVICGIVSALLPSEKYRRVMGSVLGLFMLCCFLIPSGLSFSGLAIDTDTAEWQRQQTANEISDYFFGRTAALSCEEIKDTVDGLLAGYGINSGDIEIYIDTDEESDGREITVRVTLPQRVRDRHDELHKVLEYELGVPVQLEYREESR